MENINAGAPRLPNIEGPPLATRAGADMAVIDTLTLAISEASILIGVIVESCDDSRAVVLADYANRILDQGRKTARSIRQAA